MCFAHSGTPSDVLHVQAGVGVDAAEAFTALAEADGLGSVEVIGSGTPDTVVAPRGERVLDGFSRVMHNRWNRDLEPAVTVRPGEEIQLLCRDALDIGDQARTLTADGSMTLDLGRIHPLTGPGPRRRGRTRGMGGNTDVRQLVAGSRLQLPVYVPGARFSAGDGHMAQGDGEISGTGLETLMSATLRFGVIKDTIITGPRAIVPAADPTQLAMPSDVLDQGYYITTGAGPDLMENAKNAVREMIDWLVVDRQLSLHEAYVAVQRRRAISRSVRRSTCRTGSSR